MPSIRAAFTFWNDESGISVTEYGLLIAGVVLLLMVVVQPTAASIRGYFERGLCAITGGCG